MYLSLYLSCNPNENKQLQNVNADFSYKILVFLAYRSILTRTAIFINKRAQRALGRSPEEKVKGHSGFNNREPQGHNLNNFGRGPLDDVIYQI